jgi:hypothetical protein
MPINQIDRPELSNGTSKRAFCHLFWGLGCAAILTAGLLWSIRSVTSEDSIKPTTADAFRSATDGPRGNARNNTQATTQLHDLVRDSWGSAAGGDRFPPPYVEWPRARIEGAVAKEYLLKTLIRLDEAFGKVPSYTATFRKEERLKGRLVPEQAFFLKVRQAPFAVYMKATAPASGKEVIFAKGYFGDKVVAHSAGLSRLLMPKLLLPPEHPLIRSESRHPITNAGIGNLIKNLIGYRQRDLVELDAETTLDRWTAPDGRDWLRSVHIHHDRTADRPFPRVEVLYHPETRLPLRFTAFDWADSPAGNSDSQILGERYSYDDLTLNAPLSSLDFDPANPAYHFHRF